MNITIKFPTLSEFADRNIAVSVVSWLSSFFSLRSCGFPCVRPRHRLLQRLSPGIPDSRYSFLSLPASCFILALLLPSPLTAREWSNQDGQKIEADFVSSDGTTVVMKRNGKDISYAIAKLSTVDQAFIKEQVAAKPAPAKAVTGWIQDFAIARPAFVETSPYLSHPNAKAVYQSFAKGGFPPEWTTNKKDAKAEFAYDAASARTIVYVPAGYDGSKPFGVYLHVSPGDNGENMKGYAPVMDRLNLIYISPKGSSNDQPMLRRIKLAVDALASVQAQYRTDPKRVSVGGLSGGGHMGMLIHAMFPDTFMGSVSHAAQSYLPLSGSSGHFPGLESRDLRSGVLKDHKWCVISGNKDQNYAEIQKTSELWEANRMNYKFFDVPGMGHSNAAPEPLEAALKWIGL
jgi:predicted esterase